MDSVDTLENTPLKLVAGQFGLWGLEIPESNGWKIKEVTGAHIGSNEGVIVTVCGPGGEIGEGFAPLGRFMLVAAACNALCDVLTVLEDQEVEPPSYSFDGLYDLIEGAKE